MKRHRSLSPNFLVKPEPSLAKMVQGVQVLDVEDDVLPVVMKDDEPASEEENASTFAKLDTIVIGKVKGVRALAIPRLYRRLPCPCSKWKVSRES